MNFKKTFHCKNNPRTRSDRLQSARTSLVQTTGVPTVLATMDGSAVNEPRRQQSFQFDLESPLRLEIVNIIRMQKFDSECSICNIVQYDTKCK